MSRVACSLWQRTRKWLTNTVPWAFKLNESLLTIRACANCALPINLIKKGLKEETKNNKKQTVKLGAGFVLGMFF
jgi:hypothetical protein